ncbi:PREDICTED: cytochrome c oxidase-assembly factor COX23, mitochondrial isoform X2 [Populus euphratica]|uniref:Cytochrome c oxidase-assembly factor COX23, mitochondrial isoform X2 n=1 Tax=Populus euphratica TaxID=75702 RepID=A0AAJ6TTP1_POPEU|nr:PREDICTED: cytochrome c oxidase-assembly factor COX23, mitochondrial isoform X2 [Populus euphratica]
MESKAAAAATPPHPSSARFADSQCYQQHAASLKCLEEFGSDKSKCLEHFDVYKECKKKEKLLKA